MYRTRYIPQWRSWVAERRVFFFFWDNVFKHQTYSTRSEAFDAIKRYHELTKLSEQSKHLFKTEYHTL